MKYKLIKTDLLLKGKVIHEGQTVDLTKDESENLSEYLEEISDSNAKDKKSDSKKKNKTS